MEYDVGNVYFYLEVNEGYVGEQIFELNFENNIIVLLGNVKQEE